MDRVEYLAGTHPHPATQWGRELDALSKMVRFWANAWDGPVTTAEATPATPPDAESPPVPPVRAPRARGLADPIVPNPAGPADPVGATTSGARFDFAGFLTTRPASMTVGASHDPGVIVKALRGWAGMRGLSLAGARVEDWERSL
jgi:hypothetical protein